MGSLLRHHGYHVLHLSSFFFRLCLFLLLLLPFLPLAFSLAFGTFYSQPAIRAGSPSFSFFSFSSFSASSSSTFPRASLADYTAPPFHTRTAFLLPHSPDATFPLSSSSSSSRRVPFLLWRPHSPSSSPPSSSLVVLSSLRSSSVGEEGREGRLLSLSFPLVRKGGFISPLAKRQGLFCGVSRQTKTLSSSCLRAKKPLSLCHLDASFFFSPLSRSSLSSLSSSSSSSLSEEKEKSDGVTPSVSVVPCTPQTNLLLLVSYDGSNFSGWVSNLSIKERCFLLCPPSSSSPPSSLSRLTPVRLEKKKEDEEKDEEGEEQDSTRRRRRTREEEDEETEESLFGTRGTNAQAPHRKDASNSKEKKTKDGDKIKEKQEEDEEKEEESEKLFRIRTVEGVLREVFAAIHPLSRKTQRDLSLRFPPSFSFSSSSSSVSCSSSPSSSRKTEADESGAVGEGKISREEEKEKRKGLVRAEVQTEEEEERREGPGEGRDFAKRGKENSEFYHDFLQRRKREFENLIRAVHQAEEEDKKRLRLLKKAREKILQSTQEEEEEERKQTEKEIEPHPERTDTEGGDEGEERLSSASSCSSSLCSSAHPLSFPRKPLVAPPVILRPASRTDRGVHALGSVCQYLSFHHSLKTSLKSFLLAANRRLPPDVRILAAVDLNQLAKEREGRDFFAEFQRKTGEHKQEKKNEEEEEAERRHEATGGEESRRLAEEEKEGGRRKKEEEEEEEEEEGEKKNSIQQKKKEEEKEEEKKEKMYGTEEQKKREKERELGVTKEEEEEEKEDQQRRESCSSSSPPPDLSRSASTPRSSSSSSSSPPPSEDSSSSSPSLASSSSSSSSLSFPLEDIPTIYRLVQGKHYTYFLSFLASANPLLRSHCWCVPSDPRIRHAALSERHRAAPSLHRPGKNKLKAKRKERRDEEGPADRRGEEEEDEEEEEEEKEKEMEKRKSYAASLRDEGSSLYRNLFSFDLGKMEEAAKLMRGRHSFKAFCSPYKGKEREKRRKGEEDFFVCHVQQLAITPLRFMPFPESIVNAIGEGEEKEEEERHCHDYFPRPPPPLYHLHPSSLSRPTRQPLHSSRESSFSSARKASSRETPHSEEQEEESPPLPSSSCSLGSSSFWARSRDPAVFSLPSVCSSSSFLSRQKRKETAEDGGALHSGERRRRRNCLLLPQGLRIDVVGNRFLYKMIRKMVGALVQVGLDRLSLHDIQHALLFGKLPSSSSSSSSLSPSSSSAGEQRQTREEEKEEKEKERETERVGEEQMTFTGEKEERRRRGKRDEGILCAPPGGLVLQRVFLPPFLEKLLYQ